MRHCHHMLSRRSGAASVLPPPALRHHLHWVLIQLNPQLNPLIYIFFSFRCQTPEQTVTPPLLHRDVVKSVYLFIFYDGKVIQGLDVTENSIFKAWKMLTKCDLRVKAERKRRIFKSSFRLSGCPKTTSCFTMRC